MTVVSIKNRQTRDLDDFEYHKKSDISLLYSDAKLVQEFSVELTLGEKWAKDISRDDPAMYVLDGDEFIIKPKTSVVIEVQETINVPLNLYGIIVPKGSSFLEQGIIISAGKIEPGFSGKLQFLLFNTTNKPREIKRGTSIASGVFFRTDRTVNSSNVVSEQVARSTKLGNVTKIIYFFSSDPKYTVNLIVTALTSSLVAAFVAWQLSTASIEDSPISNKTEAVVTEESKP